MYTSVTKDTILVSLMSINNETGYRLPLDCVATAIKRAESPAFFHCDNVQGFMKDIINPKKLGIDLMSISGHKVHAPKGVGALYVAKGKRIKPLMFGGGQENSMRVGTENMAGICAFAQAVKSYKKNPEIKELNRFLREELSQFSQIEINSPDNASPYILNFSLGKIKGETMLHFLAEREIFVSTGSACSGSKASHVLQNMGLEKEKIETSLRISFSNDNNKEDIIALIKALKEGFKNLAHN
ncbi:MAG: aminotransferase class V-fold PLP-dependent enzyme [Clostridia bacterium]